MWYVNAAVNNNGVNLDDSAAVGANKEFNHFQQPQYQTYQDNDFISNNRSSVGDNTVDFRQQHNFHPSQYTTDSSSTINMTDYGGNMNNATNAMANMNLGNYASNNNMNNAAALQHQQQQQQHQQQYAAAMQSGMNGMPNNNSSNSMSSNQSSMTANSAGGHPQMSSLPPGMSLSYSNVGAPQNMPQQQQNASSSLSAMPPGAAAYYNTLQNPYQLTPAATAALQAAFASPTPQSSAMLTMGGNGSAGGGNGGMGNAMGHAATMATPNIFSIANPHNDYIWGPRDTFPLRILVTREVVGQVIGKEGKNIRQVQMSSSTRIDVDRATEIYTPHLDTGEIINERKVIIHGDAKQCTAACHGLLVLLLPEELQTEAAQQQVTLRMLAPNALIGRIIGKKGVIIKQIMAETRTRITVHENGIYDQLGNVADRIVSISGNLDDVCQCENQVSERLRAGFEEFGGLEGVYAGNVAQLQQQSGHYGNASMLQSNAYSGFNNQGGGGMPTPQQLALAQQQAALLLRSLPGGSYFLSDPNIYLQNSAALLTGRSGSSASNSSSSMGYNNNQYANNFGMGGNAYGHRTVVIQQLLAQRSRGLEYTYVFVPASAVGAIIGTRGANIKQCKMQSGANLTVAPDAEDVGEFKDASIAGKPVQEWRRVTIRGSSDQQYRAQYCLFQSVGNDAGLLPQQLTEVKLRIDIPVPRAAIGRIIGKGGSTVKDIQRVGQVRLAIPDLPPPSLANSGGQSDTTSTASSRQGGNSRRDADKKPVIDGASTTTTTPKNTSAVDAVKQNAAKTPSKKTNKQQDGRSSRTSQNASPPPAGDAERQPADAAESKKADDAEADDTTKPIVKKKEKEQLATVVKVESNSGVDADEKTHADDQKPDLNAVGDVSMKKEPSDKASIVDEIGAGDAAASTAAVNNATDAEHVEKQQKLSSTKILTTEDADSSDTTPSPTVDAALAASASSSSDANVTSNKSTNKSSGNKQQQQNQQGAENSNGARTTGGPAGSSFNNSNAGNSNNKQHQQQQQSYGGRYSSNSNNNNYYDGRRSIDRDHDSYYQHRSNPNIALVQVTGFFGACQYAQDQVRTYVQAVLMSQIQQEESQQYYDKQRYDRRDRGAGGQQRQRQQQQQQPPNTTTASQPTTQSTDKQQTVQQQTAQPSQQSEPETAPHQSQDGDEETTTQTPSSLSS